ncbi:MAG: hypothetical protein WAW79_06320 [Steroidobacteraceae bacterium]
MPDIRNLSRIVVLFAAVAGLLTQAAAAGPKVDPALLGMWKQAQPGLSMYWHIREDGSYRYFGVNARPFEHWGTMEASGGQWSSRWAGGEDGGTYTVSGDSWVETGKAGTGNWIRVWKPGDGGSDVQCPLIDLAEVELQVGAAVHGRAAPTTCTLTASGVGYTDSIIIHVMNDAIERFFNVRKGALLAKRPIVNVPGIGNGAYIDGNEIHILKSTRYAVLRADLYPADSVAVTNAALIRLGRSLSRQF